MVVQACECPRRVGSRRLEKAYIGISQLVRVQPHSGRLAAAYINNDLTTRTDPFRKYNVSRPSILANELALYAEMTP